MNERYEDRIFAWATAPGRSAVAIVRLSGIDLSDIFTSLTDGKRLPAARLASLCQLIHPASGELIDEVLALYFPAPHSFTGEDVIEFHTHGSRAVINELSDVLLSCERIRLAEPGEFTRRAFEHGKMNLYEVEGLADIINAETKAQKKQAMHQYSGHYSTLLESWREQIIESMALMEAYIDFPDEEIPESVLNESQEKILSLKKEIDGHLNDNGMGEKIRDGLTAVIFGPPNAGKSSLINALAKRDVAIVSDVAGTTRDAIELHLDMNGYPVTLIDTAGIRESDEKIEQEGIRRAKASLEHADIKIGVFDIMSYPESLNEFKGYIDDNTIILVNKIDTISDTETETIHANTFPISIKNNDGISAFLDHFKKTMHSQFAQHESSLITQKRHRIALEHASCHLKKATARPALELMAEELRRAAMEIGKITGKIEVDELLDVVFGRFCIGK